MTVQCYACDRFRLKGADMARHGFGNCELHPVWQHHSAIYPHDCQHFRPAPKNVAQERQDWINRKETT